MRRAAAPQTGFSVEVFEALLTSRLFEPEWMRDRRRDAFHVLLDTPLPTRTDEAWRRTDFGALKLDEVEVVMPKADGEAARKAQVDAGRAEIEVELNRAREELRGQVARIAVAGAEKVLGREIDANAHRDLLGKLAAEL